MNDQVPSDRVPIKEARRTPPHPNIIPPLPPLQFHRVSSSAEVEDDGAGELGGGVGVGGDCGEGAGFSERVSVDDEARGEIVAETETVGGLGGGGGGVRGEFGLVGGGFVEDIIYPRTYLSVGLT